MKRVMLVVVVVSLVLVSCATPKTNKDGSPYWTTHVPKSSRTYHYEVGSAKRSTSYLSQIAAESAARDAIGRWASTSVDAAFTTFIEEAGEALKDKQLLEVIQSLSVQTVDIALRGVAIEERYTAPDGTVWVLASYPVKNLKDAYKAQAEAMEEKLAKAQADLVKSERLISYLEELLDGQVDD